MHPGFDLSDLNPSLEDNLQALCDTPCTFVDNLSLNFMNIRSPKELLPIAHFNRIGNLTIRGNKNLVNLDGFESVREVTTIHIEDNDALVSIGGLDGVEKTYSIALDYNDSLARLDAFSKVTQVHDIIFQNNSRMVDFGALQNITSLDSLTITGSSLESLNVFNSIGELLTLRIQDNLNLTHLSGFASLKKSSTLSVADNPLLSHCDVEALAARVEARYYETSGNSTSETCESP